MKIIGLFVVVFSSMAVNRLIGFGFDSQIVGAVISAGTYCLLMMDGR